MDLPLKTLVATISVSRWLVAIVFFSTAGVYCNSPSACFVASDGHSLRLYQAVIEAKKLLSELSNPDISVSPPPYLRLTIFIYPHYSRFLNIYKYIYLFFNFVSEICRQSF